MKKFYVRSQDGNIIGCFDVIKQCGYEIWGYACGEKFKLGTYTKIGTDYITKILLAIDQHYNPTKPYRMPEDKPYAENVH